MMLAMHRGGTRGRAEAIYGGFLFFVVPIAVAAIEWDMAKLLGSRLAVVCGLALLVTARRCGRSRPWLVAVAAAAPFFALPYLGGVRTMPPCIRAELDDLAKWARENTPKDAVFQFGDAGKKLEPGIFRARAKRALYADWKAGGQVNFLEPFSVIGPNDGRVMSKPQPVEEYQRSEASTTCVPLGAPATRPCRRHFRMHEWVVYDLRNHRLRCARESMPARPRASRKAPRPHSRIEAASGGSPSVSATASRRIECVAGRSRIARVNSKSWRVNLAAADQHRGIRSRRV